MLRQGALLNGLGLSPGLVFLQVGEVKKVNDLLTVSVVPNTPEGRAQEVSEVNCLLWAIGRDANAVNLGMDTTGVEFDRRGFVKVDEFQNTSVKNVYALGDIAGNKLLTPGLCWVLERSILTYIIGFLLEV